jgi:hypothetical protein
MNPEDKESSLDVPAFRERLDELLRSAPKDSSGRVFLRLNDTLEMFLDFSGDNSRYLEQFAVYAATNDVTKLPTFFNARRWATSRNIPSTISVRSDVRWSALGLLYRLAIVCYGYLERHGEAPAPEKW